MYIDIYIYMCTYMYSYLAKRQAGARPAARVISLVPRSYLVLISDYNVISYGF